jgi:hypothetical protein
MRLAHLYNTVARLRSLHPKLLVKCRSLVCILNLTKSLLPLGFSRLLLIKQFK